MFTLNHLVKDLLADFSLKGKEDWKKTPGDFLLVQCRSPHPSPGFLVQKFAAAASRKQQFFSDTIHQLSEKNRG